VPPVGTTTVGPLTRSPPVWADGPSPPGAISPGPATIAAATAAAMAPVASSRQAQDERRSSRRDCERRVLSSQRRRSSSSSFSASCARRRCGCGQPGLAFADLLFHRRASTLALAAQRCAQSTDERGSSSTSRCQSSTLPIPSRRLESLGNPVSIPVGLTLQALIVETSHRAHFGNRRLGFRLSSRAGAEWSIHHAHTSTRKRQLPTTPGAGCTPCGAIGLVAAGRAACFSTARSDAGASACLQLQRLEVL